MPVLPTVISSWGLASIRFLGVGVLDTVNGIAHRALVFLTAVAVLLPAGALTVGCSSNRTTTTPTTLTSDTTKTGQQTPATISEEELLADQRSRYRRAHERAVEDLEFVRFDWPPSLQSFVTEAELVITGLVVRVDPVRWNTPDGQRPPKGSPLWTSNSKEYQALPYVTFYVSPDENLKGTPRFGSPVAIMTYHLNGRDTSSRVLRHCCRRDGKSPTTGKAPPGRNLWVRSSVRANTTCARLSPVCGFQALVRTVYPGATPAIKWEPTG